MPQDILVIAEIEGEHPKKVSIECLGIANRLAAKTGGKVYAAVMGADTCAGTGADSNTTGANGGTQAAADVLAQSGAAVVHKIEDEKLEYYTSEGWLQALKPLIEEIGPAYILFGATYYGRDLAAMLSAAFGYGVATDVTGIEIGDDGTVEITRPIYAGNVMTKLKFKELPGIITIRPNVFEPVENPVEGTVESRKADIGDIRALVKEIISKATGRVELTEADIVVAGGRGLGNPENFKLIEQLADAVGGACGASRVIVDAGWVGHHIQVGQTGKTVNPKLYIAVGIAGAIQHLAGMQSSRVIVAINSDPEAPIFKVADYGIVADAMQILPVMIEEFRKVCKK